MPILKPLRALRPVAKYINEVSAKSTDYASQDLLVDGLRNNPYSFHHVTKHHLNYTGAFQEPEKLLPFARKFLDDLQEQGVLAKDAEDSYYHYTQIWADGTSFGGVIGCVAVQDYLQNKIKKHEEIRPEKVGFMVELFKATKILGEPTLLSYFAEEPLVLNVEEPIYDFISVDGRRHVVSKISDKGELARIGQFFNKIDNFYIADGHHRSASVAAFNEAYPRLENDFSLALLMDEREFKISAFHRLINHVYDIAPEELIHRLSEAFEVYPAGSEMYNPETNLHFGMYMGQKWYKLIYRFDSILTSVELLEREIVKDIFKIEDSSTDSQISFFADSMGIENLCALVDDGTYTAAFTVFPLDFSQIRMVADAGRVLPPKSTYIEPKIRGGMLIQEF